MPISTLNHKRCFITGAASGIGRALAIEAAAQGAELFLTDVNGPALALVVQDIERQGGKVSAHRAFDIASYPAVRAFADELHNRFGSMDVVMNVAGIAIWGTIENLTHEHWERCIAVNLMGPIHVMETLVPPMIKAGQGGQLVNVSSAAGLFGLPWHAAYSASKFGLRGVSEVLRHDLRRHHIGVSLVCPGAVNTGLVQTVQIAGVDVTRPKVRALREEFQRHAVSPEHVAEVIIQGALANRAMIFTSRDIQWGYWIQRKLGWPYELAMRWLNNRLTEAAR